MYCTPAEGPPKIHDTRKYRKAPLTSTYCKECSIYLCNTNSKKWEILLDGKQVRINCFQYFHAVKDLVLLPCTKRHGDKENNVPVGNSIHLVQPSAAPVLKLVPNRKTRFIKLIE